MADAGHNLPKPSLELSSEEWEIVLDAAFAAAIERKAELIASFKRFEEKLPLTRMQMSGAPIGIEAWNDDVQGRAGDLKDKLAALVKQADALHTLQKTPVLAASRAIDGYRNKFKADIDAAIKVVNDRRTIYARHKEDEARRVAEAEARRRQEEADRLATEAAETMEPEALERVADAYSEASAAAEQAQAPAAELSRVRGVTSVSSLVSTWKVEVDNLGALVKAVAAGTAPLRYLSANTAEVLTDVRKEGVRDVAGLHIYQDKRVR